MSERPAPRPVPGRGSGQLQELLAEGFPRMLMVQTTSACNASCVFCPLPGLRKTLAQGKMDDELFLRIVSEAGEHPEVSCINLFLMNEPLTDRKIVERIHLTRRHNPTAQISLWTNAVALKPELSDRLLASPLTSLGVSLHAHSPEAYRRATGRRDWRRVMEDLVYFTEQRLARRPDVLVVLRYVNAADYLSDGDRRRLKAFWSEAQVSLDIDDGYLGRAGNLTAPAAPRRPHRWLGGCKALGGPKQAHILYTGQVVLCCMDYRRVTQLGHLDQQTLAQVWTGPRRADLLRTLFGQQEAAPDFLCGRCELALTPDEASDCDPGVPPDALWSSI